MCNFSLSHTVSSQDLSSLLFSVISVSNFQHCVHASKFFREIAMFSSKTIFEPFFLKILMASYGARVRGSVFRMEFIILSREFESIETSPGFAQLLGENWV